MTASKKAFATYFLATSLFSLALALGYFAYVLSHINASLPAIIDEVQVSQDKLEPVLDEIIEIRLLLPGIVEEVELVRQEIGPIVTEVGLVREKIPEILSAVNGLLLQIPEVTSDIDDIVAQIPPILAEVEALRKETIPPILNEVALLRADVIPPLLVEIAEVRASVASTLEEVAVLRREMPGYFDRADELIQDVQIAGKEASEGAVVGIFTGIIKAPINLLSSIGSSVEVSDKVTDEDIRIAGDAAREMATSEQVGSFLDWRNPETRAHGRVTLIAIKSSSEKTVSLTMQDRRARQLEKFTLEIERQDDGSWIAVNITEETQD